jgi:hypothetical protein
MCYEFEQYWRQRAAEATRREAERREEERAKQARKPEKPVTPDGVKDPEPVPI